MKTLLDCLNKKERENVVITMPKGGFITQAVLAESFDNDKNKEDKKENAD